MSIKEIYLKIKSWIEIHGGTERLFIAVVVVLVGVTSFGLGRVSIVDMPQEEVVPVTSLAEREEVYPQEIEESKPSHIGNYVGSKNSDKYHLPWCGGAQRISTENKVWFESKEEAEAAGYTPAGNCNGL